jgi:hypothetical protein
LRVYNYLEVLVVAGVLACAGNSEPPPEAPRRGPLPGLPDDSNGEPALEAKLVARVPAGTFGPYLGELGERSVLAYAALDGEKRFWFTQALDAQGALLGEVRRVGPAPGGVGLVALRPLGAPTSAESGFLLLETSREFGGERVDSIALGPTGSHRGGPTPLASSLPNVVWVDALPSGKGALAFWAVKRAGSASLHAVAVGAAGEPLTTPRELVARARAWQVVPVDQGAALAYTSAGERPQADGSRVELVFVDAQAEVEGRPQVVSDSPTAEADLDLVAFGEHLVLGWSDTRDLDARLYSAVVSAKDRKVVRAPEPLTEPRGPQALVRLVAQSGDEGPAFAVWEDQVQQVPDSLRLEIAELEASGKLGQPRAILEHLAADGTLPELDATSRGLGVLTRAPPCIQGEPCDPSRTAPTFVLLDRGLDVVASEPVRLDALQGAIADLTWGLSCRHYECLALAALPSTPAPVYLVKLGGLGPGWRPAARRLDPTALPRVGSVYAVGDSPPVASLAATAVADRELVAWLTNFNPETPYVKPDKPAPDGRYAPVRAVLTVASIQGTPPGSTEVISYRAHTPGGVALAADPKKDEVLAVWSALEGGQPEVFVTLLRRDGKKIRQRMLTNSPGDVSAVAAVAVPGGWVVGWLDTRDGPPEVYVARLDPALVRMGPERRLAHGSSSVSTLELNALGDGLLAVWSDARGHGTGIAEIFTRRLSSTGETLGPEVQITRSEWHAHSPAVTSFGDGAMLGWIEENTDAEGVAQRVAIQRLDSGGEPAGERLHWEAPERALGLSIACSDEVCRVVAARAEGQQGARFDGFLLRQGAPAQATRLVRSALRPSEHVTPVVVGTNLYYLDRSPLGSVRVRRADVTWP